MNDLLDIIHQHLTWYPLMELSDIYKLIYQGVFGSEHLVASPGEFSIALENEFESQSPDPTGRLTEPLRPDQALLRINLRPYKSVQQTASQLAELCLETAAQAWGKPKDLLDAWSTFKRHVKQGVFPQFASKHVDDFTAWLEDVHYPALHHSAVYRQNYQPSYRLISNSLYHRLKLNHAA